LLPPLTFVRSSLVSATALAIPAKAKKEYLSACEGLKEKKTDVAEKRLRKAVQEYSKYSAAWVTLGQLLATRDDNDEARSSCSQGATVEPNYLPAYLCLADLAAREKAWTDVLEFSNRAIELDPARAAIAYEYNAAANLRINRLDDAEKSPCGPWPLIRTTVIPGCTFCWRKSTKRKAAVCRKLRNCEST